MASLQTRLPEFLKTIQSDLQRTMAFWFQHSHDEEYGGFYTCLGPDGKVYDDAKYSWLECRQVWMYTRLYNETDEYQKQEVLQAAIKGGEFIKKYVKVCNTQKCCLSMTREGKPTKIQQTIFSECFYLMAMSELARATSENHYREEALTMMEKILHWIQEDDTELGYPKLTGNIPVNRLAVPMMLLCLIDQLETMDQTLTTKYANTATWCLKEVMQHIQRGGTVILENVSANGEELPGCQGRLMVPGHSIEAGWFLLQRALKTKDKDLQTIAIDKFIVNPFQLGWDREHDGLFYFLDVDGWSPTQLEWDMKLWWPHNEAMIAFLMAYQVTGEKKHLENFAKVFDYSYSHFVDSNHGEWFGYLNRHGNVSHNFKGSPWKGCFHVPRSLMMCQKILQEIISK